MATRKPSNLTEVVRDHVEVNIGSDDPPVGSASAPLVPPEIEPPTERSERDDIVAALQARIAELEARSAPDAAPEPAKRPGSAHRQPFTTREMKSMASKRGAWVARRDMEYDGANLDRGQVFTMTGARNDAKLIGFGYVGEFDGGETYTCAECGSEFVGMSERASHGKLRHPRVERNPFEEDNAWDERDAMLQQAAPLNIPGPNVQNV